ncbi:MAG: hypothetical protein AAF487_02265 [Bacteroidota bacterium]
MKDTLSNDEFLAYTLLYCANADFEVSKSEIDLIKKKVGRDALISAEKFYEQDSDFERIQKIKAYTKSYSDEEKKKLYADMISLFSSDGDFDRLEQNIMRALKQVID